RARRVAILRGLRVGVRVLYGQGRVQMAIGAARAMRGVADAAIGRSYLESVRHPGIVSALGAALSNGHPDPIEFQAARPSRIVVARATPVAATPATGAVLVLHDVTELRKSDQVRRDFVANVSHELRTPLTAIRGYVEALSEESLDAEERERFMAVIMKQAGRMERLVRDLLRLASLDAREEPIENEPCSICDLLESVVRDLSPSIERKRQIVTVDVAPEGATFVTDIAKLQDALRNVLENASNYSPEGSRIQVSATRANDRVVLRVEDEGPGIPESDLERIFERFYRVDKARSRESGGTGLGLSIVKHLVQRLGGTVRAANRPTGGAVLTITLPGPAIARS
ncbi:MAG: sensor histidine kinase, partial [Bacteroidales bacterium]